MKYTLNEMQIMNLADHIHCYMHFWAKVFWNSAEKKENGH